MRGVLLALVSIAAGCRTAACGEPGPGVKAPLQHAPYIKGQLHLHSSRSADSATPADEVARWYAARGYDFIVFTDHNVVTQPPARAGLLALRGVEITQNLDRCLPPPAPGNVCLLHVNALFVAVGALPPLRPLPAPPRRLDVYLRALEATRAMGGIAQINHPNFNLAADARLLAELARRGALLLEVANQASDSNNEGGGGRPSTEALWDAVLDAGAWPVWGVASDDAHHYDDAERARARGEAVYPGDRGFVMVRAAREERAIREAIARGDFYSSTGVLLQRIRVVDGALVVEVAPAAVRAGVPHRFRFLGPRGALVCEARGSRASCRFPREGAARLRAVVEDAQGRRAWTQPLRPAPARSAR